VSVLVADGAWYEGIFHTGSSEDAGLGLVLKMATLKVRALGCSHSWRGTSQQCGAGCAPCPSARGL